MVAVGSSPCEVTFANETVIQCIAGAQSAGCYAVSVSIEGMGVASSGDSASFEYLVTVSSISPSQGGVSGGMLVTITGEGFPKFAPDNGERSGQLRFLPWFRYGVGLPALDIMGANYCPSFYNMLKDLYNRETTNMMTHELNMTVNSLEDHIREMSSRSPLQVSIGESPCVIIEATIFRISCVPLTSPTGSFDVTVTVFNQSYILSSTYTVSNDTSITVQSVSPSSGLVVGNTSVLIVGNSFGSDSGSDNVQVMIGRRPCRIKYYNNTHIQCNTPAMEPGSLPVFVSSSSGIAIRESILMELNGIQNSMISSLFPTFSYKLEITNVSLSRGSAFGGTEVTVFGGIFVSGETSVLVGGISALVLSVSDSELKFLSPSSSRIHSVDLLAQLVTIGELKYN